MQEDNTATANMDNLDDEVERSLQSNGRLTPRLACCCTFSAHANSLSLEITNSGTRAW